VGLPYEAEGTDQNPPDPNLKNPWGIARGTTNPWWVSDNMSGISTLYNGSGAKQTLTVIIPHTPQTAMGSPTGFEDQNNKIISINGLWALAFGDGLPNSDPPNQPDNALFFTAGPNFGHDGLFGTLTPVKADLTQGNDQ